MAKVWPLLSIATALTLGSAGLALPGGVSGSLLAYKRTLSQAESGEADSSESGTGGTPASGTESHGTSRTIGNDTPSPAASQDSWVEDNKQCRLGVSEDAKYKLAGDTLEVEAGDVFVEAQQPLVLKTALATIHLKKKALVFVRVKIGLERVFVFLENVQVALNHHGFGKRAGEEAILTDHEPQLVEVLVDDDIGRRRVRLHKPGANSGVGLTEFSLMQAIEREPLIYNLVHSREPKDKALKAKLLKMAAVLNMVTSRHGHYTSR